jgi:hypothetical protein
MFRTVIDLIYTRDGIPCDKTHDYKVVRAKSATEVKHNEMGERGGGREQNKRS